MPRGTREEPRGGSGDTFCGRDSGKIEGPCSAWEGGGKEARGQPAHVRAPVRVLSLPERPRCPHRQPLPLVRLFMAHGRGWGCWREEELQEGVAGSYIKALGPDSFRR